MSKIMKISRRNLIQFGAWAAAAGVVPQGWSGVSNVLNKRRVILFEMFGGNDNLNTLVPYSDPLYRQYRPTLALADKDLIKISDDTAFNRALSPLLSAWDAGDMAIVRDVGYPKAPLSHFKSIDIIERAGSGTQANRNGWVADMIHGNRDFFDHRSWSVPVVWGGGNIRGLIGNDIIPYIPGNDTYDHYISKYNVADAQSLDHLLGKTLNSMKQMSSVVGGRIVTKSRFFDRFYNDDQHEAHIGMQCERIVAMLESGVDSPVFKIGMSGFDTHANLLGTHRKMLSRAARNLATLRQSLQDLGEWDSTLIVAYSEFGRRPFENASGGTDHGSAGPMILLGGKVHGGLKGRAANLDDLNGDGNLKFSTDYRQIFSTVAQSWLELKYNPLGAKGFKPFEGLIG